MTEVPPEYRGEPRSRRRRVADLAGKQWGRVSTRQLAEIGIPATTLSDWARDGWLHRVHRGVYAVGHMAPSLQGTLMAAVLAIGDDAYVSHVSAGLLWKLIRIGEPPWVDVTCPRKLAGRKTIRTHFTRNPHHTDHQDIPTSTPLQTLLDLATTLDQDWLLRRAASQALIDDHFDLAALRERCVATPGHRGAARLQRLLPTLRRTRSGLEDRVLDLIQTHGLPQPRVNDRLHGHEVDLHWPHHRLIVEIDGDRYHDNPFAQHEDRAKQALLEANGYRVVRITERDLPSAAQVIRAALA